MASPKTQLPARRTVGQLISYHMGACSAREGQVLAHGTPCTFRYAHHPAPSTSQSSGLRRLVGHARKPKRALLFGSVAFKKIGGGRQHVNGRGHGEPPSCDGRDNMDGAPAIPLTKEQQKRLEDGLHVKGYSARANIAYDVEIATMTVYNIEEPVVVTLPLPEFIAFLRQACSVLQEEGHLQTVFAEEVRHR